MSHGEGDAPQAPNLASLDLNLLVLLHALLEEQSVTRAADRVGLSQPAMSHALRRIRRLFEDEVLVRQGSTSTLTPRAAQLRAPLREVLDRAAGLFTERGFATGPDAREITVALAPSAAFILGQSLSRLLAAEAPEVRLNVISTMDLSDSLFTGAGVDALIMSEVFETAHPRERVFDDEWVVVGGDPELTHDTAERLLSEWPHVVYRSALVSRPYDVFRERGVRYTVQVRVNDALLIPQFVAGTQRIGVHRRRVAEVVARSSPLWVARLPFLTGGIGLDLVWNPWLRDAQFQAWFRDVVTRAARAG